MQCFALHLCVYHPLSRLLQPANTAHNIFSRSMLQMAWLLEVCRCSRYIGHSFFFLGLDKIVALNG